jgi:hypothetical protein
MKFIILILSVILTGTYLSAENRFEMLVGDVRILSPGSKTWHKSVSGQKVSTGDTIQTGTKSFAMINADGNSIKINANTKVKFAQDIISGKPQSALSLFNGSINCKIDKLKKNKSGFNVNTASSTCAVRGTDFDVAAGADGKTILQVTDGIVELSGTSKTVAVLKNQESSVKIGGEPEPVKIIKRQDWEKWAEEISNEIKGKEKTIITGCLVKIEKLDMDITQLENESAAAKKISGELKLKSEDAKKIGDSENAVKFAGEAEKSYRLSTSLHVKAFYQASRIELVKNISDNAFDSSEEKSSIDKLNKRINEIYNKHYIKYIKPIHDSEKLRQEVKDKKKIKKK